MAANNICAEPDYWNEELSNENEFFKPFRKDLIEIANNYFDDVKNAATFLTLWDHHFENMGRGFDDLYDEFESRFKLVGEIDPNKLSNCLKDNSVK